MGFDLVGIASADPPGELAAFSSWVAKGFAGEMSYLTGQVGKRSDLYCLGGMAYLEADCHEDGILKTFRIDRITAAHLA